MVQPPPTTEAWPAKSWRGPTDYTFDTSFANANPTVPGDEIVSAVFSIYPIGAAQFGGGEIVSSDLRVNGARITVNLARGRWRQYTVFLEATTSAGQVHRWFIALPCQAFEGAPAELPPEFYFGCRLTWTSPDAPGIDNSGNVMTDSSGNVLFTVE